LLLTSLIEAADRVDSTVGLQMAYLKQWAPRASNRLTLRVPELLAGSGTARRGDAVARTRSLGSFDLAYLDPPYNQHRYFTNYHVWETLVAWDEPEHYGIACKRLDARDDETKSPFNRKREMPEALRTCIEDVDARLVILSYNDESWIALDALIEICAARGGRVAALAFDSARYVGAQIGVHNPAGERVGEVSHLRNLEYVLVCGEPDAVGRVTAPYESSKVTV
jgi:adenine-specific DNA-methyltransferase